MVCLTFLYYFVWYHIYNWRVRNNRRTLLFFSSVRCCSHGDSTDCNAKADGSDAGDVPTNQLRQTISRASHKVRCSFKCELGELNIDCHQQKFEQSKVTVEQVVIMS
jgi:hypothetical protein